MDDTIKVYVIDKGRASLYMLFRDPTTGKETARSTGTKSKKEALKAAGEWEAELRSGKYKPKSRVTWAEFRQRYEDEVVSGLADKTAIKIDGVLNSLESLISPARLVDVTADKLSAWQQKLRDAGKAEATIKGHLAHLAAALAWAVEIGLLTAIPKIRMPQRVKGGKVMKGRPITAEEFDRLIDAVPKSSKVKPDHVEGWRFLLRGLWWSGLRLGEAMQLSWDTPGMMVDLTGKRPMLRILAGSEKGHKDRLLPLAPEFGEMLLAVPESERTGFVFNPLGRLKKRPRADSASHTICDIGEKAGIKVDETEKGVKFASAHDCRRAFGLRWAARVMPAVLQQLMRHENIETTLRFYVGNDAEGMADVLYAAVPKSPPKVDSSVDSSRIEESAVDVTC
ncbi:site-specific tyrosine recombinase XerC [Caulifigura coniformis]|uniref:Site-specific tyrosine recombinase XerC n=1 Tax=Caulifigura coniformis TaxID=2527983 RepID=A0A517SL99_9PLAN|nr:site-specific integrase [Caulifigura coniformis]QDT56888.1 site-specific tyrosine recombinase XerC [Caulifigura coniformis]